MQNGRNTYKTFRLLWSLLFIAMAIHFLYPVSYSIHISRIRREQSMLINSKEYKDYTIITLSRKAYEEALELDNKELELNGEMYDIISILDTGDDKVVCKVLHDSEETDCREGLASGYEKDTNKKILKRVISWCPVTYNSTTDIHINHIFFDKRSFPGLQAPTLSDGFLHTIIKPPAVNNIS